jgi:hypothetical protein
MHIKIALTVCSIFLAISSSCEMPYQKEDIDEVFDNIPSPRNYDLSIRKALQATASSYKPQAIEHLRRFLKASEDIAKGEKSFLRKKLDYSIDLPNMPRQLNASDDIVIILDAGFSDVALSYSKDVLAYYEMIDDGALKEKNLDLVLPRWAWYLYELQEAAGTPLRVIRELIRQGLPVEYPSLNLINNTDYVDLLRRHNKFHENSIIYGRQQPEESAYHGAAISYLLKEYAPSAKLILVRYNMANANTQNEFRMVQDLDAIAKKFNAGFLVRSSLGHHHWHGLMNNRQLLKDLLIINAALDKPMVINTSNALRTFNTRHNFFAANTFSTGCTGIKIAHDGVSYSQIQKDLAKIAPFSFFRAKFSDEIRHSSSVFINRHSCWNKFNMNFEHGECINNQGFFPIGFDYYGTVNEFCSVEPVVIGGDSSSAAPLAAAWAIFVKKRAKITKMDEYNATFLKNHLTGIREGCNEQKIFQDPIASAEFSIFEEGYKNGLIIPKKFSDI